MDSPPGTAIDQACWCVAMSMAYTARSVLTNTRLLAATMLRMNISPAGAGQLHWDAARLLVDGIHPVHGVAGREDAALAHGRRGDVFGGPSSSRSRRRRCRIGSGREGWKFSSSETLVRNWPSLNAITCPGELIIGAPS